MNSNFVESIIRKLNMRMLFLSLGGLLLVGIGLAVNVRYLANMVLGPMPISRGNLLALSEPSSLFRYFVSVEGDDHGDTGYQYVNTSESGKETVEAYYHVLVISNALLLVKSTEPAIADKVKGALVGIPSDTQSGVITELEKEMPELKGAFLPVMLDATNFYSPSFAGLAIAAAVGLISMWGLVLATRRITNPEAHPIMKALERFGVASQVKDEIDMEIASEHSKVGKKIHLTRKWLISTTNSLDAMRYQDIIWCYKQVTQHRTNGIPTGKTYATHVADRYGKMIVISGREDEVNQVLQSIVTSVPGVVAGYSNELRQMWQKDRAKFVAAVDERRRSAASSGQSRL